MLKTSAYAFAIAVFINFGLFCRGPISVFGGSDKKIEEIQTCWDYLRATSCGGVCGNQNVNAPDNFYCRTWGEETNGNRIEDPNGGHCDELEDGEGGFCTGSQNYANGTPGCLNVPCLPF